MYTIADSLFLFGSNQDISGKLSGYGIYFHEVSGYFFFFEMLSLMLMAAIIIRFLNAILVHSISWRVIAIEYENPEFSGKLLQEIHRRDFRAFLLYICLLFMLTLFSSVTVASFGPTYEVYEFVLGRILMLFLGVYLLLSFPFSIFVDYFASKFEKTLMKLLMPESFMIVSLSETLLLLKECSADSALSLLESKIKIIAFLEEVSDCFEHDIVRKFKIKNSYEKVLLQKEFKHISNGFRSMQSWLYTPMSDTREYLFLKLRADFESILLGNYHDLTKLERPHAANISRKEVIWSQIQKWSSLTFRTALPFLILWGLELTPISLSDVARDYLLIGAFALSALIFTIELDPNFGEKLGLLQRIKEIINSRRN